MKDYFQILGVERGADNAQIRKAYLALVKRYHPDKNPDPSAKTYFQEVQEAYDVLSDETKRTLILSHDTVDLPFHRRNAEQERRDRIYAAWIAHQKRQGRRREFDDSRQKQQDPVIVPNWFKGVNLLYNTLFMFVFLLVLIAPIYSYINEMELPEHRRRPIYNFIFPALTGAILTGYGYYYWYILKTDRIK